MIKNLDRVTSRSAQRGVGAISGRVLVVDDEPNVRLVFRTALESAGFEVDEASNGVEAIASEDRRSADVILLDLKMPGMGGMEVLRRLREAGSEVPVVIVTAHGSVPDAVAAMKLGAIDFIRKPLTPEALREVASDVIRRHTASDQAKPPVKAAANNRPEITLLPSAIDLTPAKRALNRCEFEKALALLEEVLDAAPDTVEALTLIGVVSEIEGRNHAAYQSYKKALTNDQTYGPALENMRRYCDRFGLDFNSKAINPAAEG